MISFKKLIRLNLILLILTGVQTMVYSQEYTLYLDRGKLWHSYYISQECEPMADWSRKTVGLDWPGFRTEEIKQNIGGSNSYLVAGGFFISAKTDSGTVWGWDNFATHGTDVGFTGDQFRYLIMKDENNRFIHRRWWRNGENYWLQSDPYEAEDVIETQWEMNGAWYQPWDNQNMPVSVRRLVRQWSGSQADENYIITEYTIRNIQRRESLDGVYLMFTFALSPNHRGWNLTYPNFPDGARNTKSSFDEDKRLLLAWAGDLTTTPGVDESFDYFEHLRYDAINDRNIVEPEFVAPGILGIKFLYISPDSTGQENRLNGFAWSAAAPSNDHSGPFLGVAGLDNKYAAMADPLKLSEAFDDPNDIRMGQNRIYANFSFGPFNIPRRDSVRIVMAEFVGGMNYEQALDPGMTVESIRAACDSAADYLDERITFNYEHQYTVPMPPPAPMFTVSAYDKEGVVGNVIRFDDHVESIPDPHQNEMDIVGYRIYRSGNLPFGPWIKIAEIMIQDERYFDPDSQQYEYVDTQVPLGYGFYYSVTSFDSGHSTWTFDASYEVPPLETSVFANRTSSPFYTTLKPTKSDLDRVTVVPNPFYRSSGFQLVGDTKLIQFVNLSEKCTIRIYTVRGDLVKTIEHNDPSSGIAFWNQISDYGQYVKSGMYFYHVTNDRGDTKKGKFAIIN
ncbi:T9SS type A sorting domain-containing protein [candidate division KSB1 bacterium]|nr:T9SS type A sorting domain-containing protein [candidate division KSB1 bacterium]